MIGYYKRYGLWGFLRLAQSYVFTFLFYGKSRLIRLPIDIRNKRNIDFGTNLTSGSYCRFEAHPQEGDENKKLLTFGDNVQLNDFVHIVAAAQITIGNNVLMASKIFISDSNHGGYSGEIQSHPDSIPIARELVTKPIHISDNVWLGEFVTVLPGVNIGKGSIIGSMSVVSKDIPPYCIAVGSPARVIKRFNVESNKWEKI